MARTPEAEKQRKVNLKQKAQAIASALNELEEIFNSYSVTETKQEVIPRIANLCGKISILFTDVAAETKIFEDQ